MNSWLLLRRLRGPAFIILVGITALLDQWGILGFGRSWPLYLILAGIFGLAERAVLTGAPPVPAAYPTAYPASTYAPGAYGPVVSTPAQPAQSPDSTNAPYVDPNGGRS